MNKFKISNINHFKMNQYFKISIKMLKLLIYAQNKCMNS